MTEETRNAEQLGKEAGGRRRRKGLSLSDISGRTKIRVQFLEAIENGTLQDLPQSLYARGFVRRYLEVIESQDLWAEYEQIFRSIPEKGSLRSLWSTTCLHRKDSRRSQRHGYSSSCSSPSVSLFT